MERKQMAKEMFILTNKLKRLLDKKHSINGLYAGQSRILTYLYHKKDEVTYQKDLEQAFQIRGGTVTGMIDVLVNNGYIQRIESELDRRKRRIILTDTGEKMALKAIETITQLENDIYQLLTESERKVFSKITSKIDKWLDEEETK